MGTTASQPAPREDETIDATLFTDKLSDNIESNDFSNLSLDGSPIAVDLMARAPRDSPKELLKEALGFSIMSRNVNLVIDLLEEIGENVDITGLYPLHLAGRYLDGSKTCCNVLDALDHPRSLRKIYVNDLGHPVLDQLMITILKAHTSCLPSVVDVIFKKDKRFEGEDVDICGRWNADSDCVRTLLANGPSGIPFQWKYMALLGNEDVDECSHEEMDPVELAMKVPASSSSMWSRELSTGWQVLTIVLRHSQAEWKARPSRRRSNSNEREDEHEFSTFIEYGED
ncbi:hypothetical protein HO133_007758 [Letharia lupina]|uniref:Uncharacterized protein n=1 Tax=Letharia lupina TaxID=560253 RepID=A0A8H6CQK0_9LECA|nr:uncharacterized protein HO133_007758 [Letharia lupina]KAF6228030.1 hypothetical protein HO133_007758 [Letharia lupina]